MPLYEYECEACGRRFEVIQRFSDPPHETCLACGGGPVRKLLSPPAIQFKGTGWYVTDYAAKDKPKAEGEGKPSAEGSGEKKAAEAPASSSTESNSKSSPSSEASSGPAAPRPGSALD